MSGFEIRPPREEEFPAVLRIGSLAFGEETAPEEEESFRHSFPFDRGLCAYEDGKMVATSAVYSLELTLPGSSALPTGGVTWIATLPTHRRKGLLRLLMERHFADMEARGEPLSALLASESHIYGRFGYGPATSSLSFSVERPYAGFASPTADRGRMVLLDSGEAAAELPEVYERVGLPQPGAVSRPSGWWKHYLSDPVSEREGAGHMCHAKHETPDGVADGYVSYRTKEEWSAGSNPMNEVQVVELLAATPQTYEALWEYVLGTDLSRTVSCRNGRPDEPLRWMLSHSRRFEVKALVDFLYLRLLDVPRALTTRAYGSAGELVFEVADTFPQPSLANYSLRVEPVAHGGADCVRTDREADLRLTVVDLAAAYLGGVSFSVLAQAGRVRELRPGAIALADAMFSTASAPYCSTMF